MISQRQSTRFNIGQPSSSASSIESLSYSTIPNSPQITDKKREHEEKPEVTRTKSAGQHVFIPQKDDVVKHRFRLRYSPCSDSYYREWDDCVLSRVGGNIRHWEKGIYSFESVERVVDTNKNLVYLERTAGSNTGILIWKIDLKSCGLVIDEVSIKVTSLNMDGGEVLVMLSSNKTKKTISHMEGLGVVKMKVFENSNNLILTIHLIGETAEQKTRLFENDILSKGDYPLDLKITLKPPFEMYNKPVILLGLMFSNSQETSVDRRHYRTHSCSSGRGFLHINIVQGKNISTSKDSTPDAQVKCYLLPDDKNIKSCKTGRSKNSSSPIWDEYFLIDGIAQSQLRMKQLGIRVVNWKLGINRKNTRLGELRIGIIEMFDFIDLSSNGLQQTTNAAIIYTPLMQVKDEQKRKGRSPDDPKISNSLWYDEPDTLGNNDVDWNCNQSSTSNKNVQISLNNDEQIAETDKNTNEETREELSKKVKPKRPPLPFQLNLNRSHTPARKHSEEDKKGSPRKATTPTLSRLMTKLPMSPRGRRSSWGGESDLSLQSPRSSTQSPGAYEGLESCQWDVMISRPKEWIYTWQALGVSECGK